MINSPWWNMFENYGMGELYTLYRLMESQEKEDAGDENGGADTYRSKFE